MKIFVTNTYLEALVSDIAINQEFSVPVKGVSMIPFLKENRDRVIMKSYCGQSLHKGDILLFQRYNGDFVLHRIMEMTDECLMMLGDNQLLSEPITEAQVRAVAVKAVRKGREITPESWIWRFFSQFWRRWIFLRKLSASVSKTKQNIVRSKK